MTQFRPPQVAFSSGEVSPFLYARNDYQRFQTGVRAMRGFLPMREGGFTRAPGTLFRGYTKDNNRARFLDFEFAVNDALTLEFTDGVIRVWRYGQLVEVTGMPGTVYELASPYTEARLDQLQWEQSADVIYLADGAGPIQKLSRFALDNWTIAPAHYKSGPFRIQNLDEAITIQASAMTGAINLAGVGDPFEASHVGVQMRMTAVDYTNIPLWSSNTAVAINDQMRVGVNVYQLVAGASTGVSAPVHVEGTQLVDKTTGAKWKHVSDGSGIVEITGFTNANLVAATVIKSVPQACVDDPTYRFAESAWSGRHGYPKTISIYDQSFFAAASPSSPRTIWVSTLGAFDNFEPSTEADGSFAYGIGGTNSQNGINWLARGRKGIYIGALGEVFRGFSTEVKQRIGPTTFDTETESTDGSTGARPIAPYGYPIFITKDGNRVAELRYSFEEDGGTPLELSAPSDHIGPEGGGFAGIVWQSSPRRLAWLRRGIGDLAVMLYDPKEDVLGWAVCSLAGGVVETMSVTSSPTGGNDILTMVVRREIDGATVRMVEEQALIYGTLIGVQPIHEAVHFFASSVFVNDPETDTFSVPHLVGQDVYAWTDRGEFGPLTVPAGGEIVLGVDCGHAVIGLFDETHHCETLDIQAVAKDGDPRGRPERLHAGGGLVLHRTAAGRVAAVERDFDDEPRIGHAYELIDLPVAADLVNSFSGTTDLSNVSGFAQETSLRFTPRGGAPMTVLAIIPPIEGANA